MAMLIHKEPRRFEAARLPGACAEHPELPQTDDDCLSSKFIPS
jgi:hypothetical protein